MQVLTQILTTLRALRQIFEAQSMPDFVRLLDEGATSLIQRSNLDLSQVSASVPTDPDFLRLYTALLPKSKSPNTCSRSVRFWKSYIQPKKTGRQRPFTFAKNPVLAGLNSIKCLTQEK